MQDESKFKKMNCNLNNKESDCYKNISSKDKKEKKNRRNTAKKARSKTIPR